MKPKLASHKPETLVQVVSTLPVSAEKNRLF